MLADLHPNLFLLLYREIKEFFAIFKNRVYQFFRNSVVFYIKKTNILAG